MTVNREKLNPMVDKIMSSVLSVKDDIPQSMIVNMINYCLGEVSSNLRVKLKLYDNTVKPLNYYSYIFAPSSTGKDLSLNAMNKIFVNSFSEKMNFGFNKHKSKYWEQRAMTLVDEDCEDVDAQIKEEMRLVSPFSYRISSGSEAGVGKYRVTSSLYNIGALNLVIDEAGSNYQQFRGLLSLMLSTYEDGNSEARQLKETGLIAVKGVPSNMLLYSSPVLMFDGGTNEKSFFEDLEQGMARRSFFAYVEKPKAIKLTAVEKVEARMKKADEHKDNFTEIGKYFEQLAKPKNMYREMFLTKEADITLAEYQIQCDDKVEEARHMSELEKIELTNRAWKATRLAGIYAFISNAEEITVEFAEQAIYITELSGVAFNKVCNRPPIHERLFEFINGRAKTSDVDLIKMKWFPKNITQKRDLMSLARAYGYEQDHLFKIKEIEGVEFYSFVELPKTNVDKITVSISKDITKGFKKKVVPFEILHEVVCNPDFNYSAGTFKKGHRNKENYEQVQNLIIIDIDDGMKLSTARKMFANYKCLIATTKSHQKDKNGLVCDRFRIVFVTDRTIKLDSDTYGLFMENVYESLGVPADTSCKDSSRFYYGAEGDYWYSEGDKLFEIGELIPDTSKEKERKTMLNSSGIGSTHGVERVLLEEAIKGNRNHTILRWALFLKDSGYDFDDAEKKVIEFNEKLPEPITQRELSSTVLRSLKRKYG